MPRISSLPSIAGCPGFATLRAAGPDEGSGAANTGSCVGRIIELWHRNGEGATALEEAAATAEREKPEKFPRADMDEARTHALGYAADPRNRGVVVAQYCELEVTIDLPPSPDDDTGAPVRLVGHLDQIRRDPITKGLRVWDLKNGKPAGLELLYAHAWQIAAYSLAATRTLGEPVLPGGIIRLKAYGSTRSKREADTCAAHYDAPWTLEQCASMMEDAASEVALLRAGLVLRRPGMSCLWCPAGAPNLCGDRIDRLASVPRSLL